MSKKYVFYCWIRVISREKAEEEASEECDEVAMLIPHKPPKRVTSPDKPNDIDEAWIAVEGQYNNPVGAQWLFDYNHAFWSRVKAMDWIHSADGDAWTKNAASYSLLTFEVGVD
jgi:hypothetical protein